MDLTENIESPTERLVVRLIESDYSDLSEEMINLIKEEEEDIATEAVFGLLSIAKNKKYSEEKIKQIVELSNKREGSVKRALSFLIVSLVSQNLHTLEKQKEELQNLVGEDKIVNENILFVMAHIYSFK